MYIAHLEEPNYINRAYCKTYFAIRGSTVFILSWFNNNLGLFRKQNFISFNNIHIINENKLVQKTNWKNGTSWPIFANVIDNIFEYHKTSRYWLTILKVGLAKGRTTIVLNYDDTIQHIYTKILKPKKSSTTKKNIKTNAVRE